MLVGFVPSRVGGAIALEGSTKRRKTKYQLKDLPTNHLRKRIQQKVRTKAKMTQSGSTTGGAKRLL
jgi:hypothetical protein